jgi:hypothetical protein
MTESSGPQWDRPLGWLLFLHIHSSQPLLSEVGGIWERPESLRKVPRDGGQCVGSSQCAWKPQAAPAGQAGAPEEGLCWRLLDPLGSPVSWGSRPALWMTELGMEALPSCRFAGLPGLFILQDPQERARAEPKLAHPPFICRF